MPLASYFSMATSAAPASLYTWRLSFCASQMQYHLICYACQTIPELAPTAVASCFSRFSSLSHVLSSTYWPHIIQACCHTCIHARAFTQPPAL